MPTHKIVSKEEWLAQRLALLNEEKAFDRQRDRLNKKKRELPWVKIDKNYVFETTDGTKSLAELFGEHSQLIIYHFMYGPDWNEGCPICSYWADNFNGMPQHLQQRDVNFVVVSRAPLNKLLHYKKRMNWNFEWASSHESDFNFDFQVSFTPEEIEKGEMIHNFKTMKFPASEAPGLSVFQLNENGDVFHTYSTYQRGLDMFLGAYHYLDIVPKGRNESDLPFSMAWVRRHDQYN